VTSRQSGELWWYPNQVVDKTSLFFFEYFLLSSYQVELSLGLYSAVFVCVHGPNTQ
jgi:hypothetical protein